jgi:hypothetical protein
MTPVMVLKFAAAAMVATIFQRRTGAAVMAEPLSAGTGAANLYDLM